MANHLIIGIGGTGGRIIRSLRKTVFQEFGEVDPTDLYLRYLYIDSDTSLMALDDPSWKIFGESVQLGPSAQVRIEGSDLKQKLDSIEQYPGIKNWIGSQKIWGDILNSLVSESYGGQKRRLGRFLMASKVDNFKNQLNTQVAELRAKSGETDVTFHIGCGLAGGTGGGCVIDTVCQIRKNFPRSNNAPYRIVLYTFLPDKNPPGTWDSGNYHSNGYAALQELNALSIGEYRPYDIAGEIKGRMSAGEYFNGCYVFTNQNENGKALEMGNEDIPNLVSDFLFQKIVRTGDAQLKEIVSQENGENGDSTPEKMPENLLGERSKRFLSFGIKRLGVPEREINEFLTYSFSQSAALHVLYNNWSENGGYLAQPSNFNVNQLVQDKKQLEDWKITEEHLIFSRPIIEDKVSSKWKSIGDDWRNYINHFKDRILKGEDSKVWLTELISKVNHKYDVTFRADGVKNFYLAAVRDRKKIARHVVENIESDLFDQWKSGESNRSIHDCVDILDALLNYLDKRKGIMEDKRVDLIDREVQEQAKLDDNKAVWARIGVFSAFFMGKRKSTFEAVSNNLEKIYIFKTRIEGLDFGKKLVLDIIDMLTELKGNLNNIASNITSAVRSYEGKLKERCVEDYAFDSIPERVLNDNLIKYYDAKAIRNKVNNLLKDEMVQKEQTANVRTKIFEYLNNIPSFTHFLDNIHETKFADILEQVCSKESIKHQNSADRRILGINIITRLKQKYQGKDQELKIFINSLIERAGCYVSFDPNERLSSGPGTQGGNQDSKELTVIIPRLDGEQEFTDQLWEVVKSCKSDKIDAIHLVYVDGEKYGNEIVFINVTNLFPLRYVEDVAALRRKYETRLDHPDGERRRTEIHTEDFAIDALPPLFLPDSKELKRKEKTFQDGTIPYILIAKKMDLITRIDHPETGVKQEAILQKDEHGFDLPPVFLGNEFSLIPVKIGKEQFVHLKNNVESLLKDRTQYLHEEKRDELTKGVKELISEVTKDLTVTDPVSIAFNNGGRSAVTLLKTLNR